MKLRKLGIHLSAATASILFTVGINEQITVERPVSTPVFTPITAVISAAIASDGDQFLAAWSDSNGVLAARIGRVERAFVAARGRAARTEAP